MYDVVSRESSNDSVSLYCIEDEKESQLYSYFDKYFEKLINEDSGKEEDLEGISNSLSQFYSKPVVFEFNPREYLTDKYSSIYFYNLLDGVQFLLTPPPRS